MRPTILIGKQRSFCASYTLQRCRIERHNRPPSSIVRTRKEEEPEEQLPRSSPSWSLFESFPPQTTLPVLPRPSAGRASPSLDSISASRGHYWPSSTPAGSALAVQQQQLAALPSPPSSESSSHSGLSKEPVATVAAAVAHPTHMHAGSEHSMGAPSGFAARRPNASSLPNFELPPPPISTAQKYHYSTTQAGSIQGHPASVGNLLTPPSNLSGDGLSPTGTTSTASNSAQHGQQHQYTPHGYVWSPHHQNPSYNFQTGAQQPYSQQRSSGQSATRPLVIVVVIDPCLQASLLPPLTSLICLPSPRPARCPPRRSLPCHRSNTICPWAPPRPSRLRPTIRRPYTRKMASVRHPHQATTQPARGLRRITGNSRTRRMARHRHSSPR